MADEVEGGDGDHEVYGDVGYGVVSAEQHLSVGEGDEGEGEKGEDVFRFDAEEQEYAEGEFDVGDHVGVGRNEEAREIGFFGEGGGDPGYDAVVVVVEGVAFFAFELAESGEDEAEGEEEAEGDEGPGFGGPVQGRTVTRRCLTWHVFVGWVFWGFRRLA